MTLLKRCEQLSLFPELLPSPINRRTVKLLDLDLYDLILLEYSGGKDSLSTLLLLLNMGVPKNKIQLWHQSVDGEPGSQQLFDWPCTEDYVKATGIALGIETYNQWRLGGFQGELYRENSLSQDVGYIYKGEKHIIPTTKGNLSTRRKFPAKSADLRVRYCSAYLKIDVAAKVITNIQDFKGSPESQFKLLVITGERALESLARSKYLEVEEHRCNTKSRLVHHWRPVISFKEEQVWEFIEKYRITPHPAYILGFSRTSCLTCVFLTPDLWAMVREIAPDRFYRLVEMEKELGHTIDNKLSLLEMANRGSIKRMPREALNSRLIQKALSGTFSHEDFFMDKWELPAGALRGADGGPT